MDGRCFAFTGAGEPDLKLSDYGAVGDGQTDDIGALVKALFWASDSQAPFIDKFGKRSRALTAEYAQRPKHKIRSGNFPPAWYVRTEKWKLIGWDDEVPVLFDMTKDIGETTDLSQKHPEVVSELSRQFAAWMDQQQAPAYFPSEQFERLKAVH